MSNITVHKRNTTPESPLISIILLDWSVRERFHTLDWLSRQNVPREKYELVWVELYNRVVPEVMQKADLVITCGQKGLYHKHVGLNVGLLHARGEIVTVCDSDAVYPLDFLQSILTSFRPAAGPDLASLVLMHYERRSSSTYPEGLSAYEEVAKYPVIPWSVSIPNVGACMSVRRIDALRFGGFDEHESLRGYICGPNDLGWRLVNAGLPEIWHDERVCLFHFAHPHSNQFQNEGAWKEMRYPHIDHHALTSVQAFCSGRLLPLVENPDIHKLRMSMRRIGTKLEERFAWMQPLSRSAIARRRLYLVVGNVLGAARAFLGPIPGVRPVNRAVRRLLTTMGGRAAGI